MAAVPANEVAVELVDLGTSSLRDLNQRLHDLAHAPGPSAWRVINPNGALATLEASTCVNPGRPRRIEIAGSRGTAILEGDELLQGEGRSAGPPPANAGSPVVADASAHRDVFADFMRAVRDGNRPCCDGREGRRSVALVEAIYESSRTGLPVDVGQ